MNPTSVLQQQFPLSPRKFWKKVIGKLLAWYILAFVGIVIDLVIIVMTNGSYDSGASAILWGILIIILIFVSLITILYGWYIKVYIKRYYYAGEEYFITIKKGVFAPTEIHVQWQKIQDVYVDQDILDRIMGLYDVHIASATAASGIEAHIDGVDQVAAEGLKKFLLDKVSGAGRGIPNNSSTQSPNETQQPPHVAKINLSEDISSNTYPLTTKWLTIKIISSLISPFMYWAIIVFFVFAKLSDNVSSGYSSWYIFGYLGVSIISAIGHLIGVFLWKKNYAFNFTPDNIYYREGVISLSEKHMPYSSIQDVTVQQGILERLVGLAKVRIENAAQQTIQTGSGQRMAMSGGVVLQGLNLSDANKITNILKTTVLGRNTSQYGL